MVALHSATSSLLFDLHAALNEVEASEAQQTQQVQASNKLIPKQSAMLLLHGCDILLTWGREQGGLRHPVSSIYDLLLGSGELLLECGNKD